MSYPGPNAHPRWRRVSPRGVSAALIALLGAGVVAAPSAAAPTPANQLANLVQSVASDTPTANYPFQDKTLSDDARVRDLISRMTLDEKVGMLHQFSAAVTRLGVPQFRTGTEGLHGLSWLGYATVFPQASGIGMTWNPDLAGQIGDVIGEEARAYNSVDARFNGVDIWGPVVDIARDPRTGRVSESMGEDPLLISQMATAMGQGMQGNEDGYLQSIPTLKHFAAYGQEASRTAYSANAGVRATEEYYFKVFKDPIEAGAVNSMMTGYNLTMDAGPVIWSGAVQGFGMGFIFVPLTTLAFATIANKYRTDATSIFSLVRNMGSGVGISMVTAVLSSMLQVNHEELGSRLTATSGAVRNLIPSLISGVPEVVAQVNGLVSQQAAMLSYLDDFQLMVWVSLATVPIVLLLRGSKPKAGPPKSAEEKALERAHAMAE